MMTATAHHRIKTSDATSKQGYVQKSVTPCSRHLQYKRNVLAYKMAYQSFNDLKPYIDIKGTGEAL